jgi:hypothetical protein
MTPTLVSRTAMVLEESMILCSDLVQMRCYQLIKVLIAVLIVV